MTLAALDLCPLARRIQQRAAKQPSRRFVVAIGGIPGSGKSTIAYPLVNLINKLSSEEVAVGVGVDGWHYSQAQLRAMENTEHLFVRRGAHFTFDAEAYSAFIWSLDNGDEELHFPTFSHSNRDPVQGEGTIRSVHRIVIIEGLHCLLDIHPWSSAAKRYDERVYVDTPTATAEQRIIKRHLADGVEPTIEAATRRAQQSDMLNATTLISSLVTPTVIVQDGMSRGVHIVSEAGDCTAAL